MSVLVVPVTVVVLKQPKCSLIIPMALPFRRQLSAAASNPISLFPRFNYALKLQRRKNFSTVYATNDNSTEKDSPVETADEIKAGQGPPFLTILAGFIVMFLLGWILWSILTSLAGLIVQLFSSK